MRKIGCVLLCICSMIGIIWCNADNENMANVDEVATETVEITETTTETTKITTSTMVSTTSENPVTTETTTYVSQDITDDMTYLGSFTATYYQGSSVPCYGGSGRMLYSCYEKDDIYKGSVASRLVYGQYGYEVNSKTMVYIEFEDYPMLDGWYSVDDCNSDSSIVDFYFADYSTCPWQNDGVTGIEMWIGGIE